jgi:hypothetical protein
MNGGSSALFGYTFSGNTGYNGYQDMHRASGTLTFATSCPAGTFNFGYGVINCDACWAGYFPQVFFVAECRPWTGFENASTQDELQGAIMFNRTIALTADIQLSSGVALLTKWRDRSSLLQGIVFDGQVAEQRSL